MAVQLEDLRGELARKAVLGSERLRVARDIHDLLGLGLSAIAMKADLIGRLIDRGDARTSAEIAELARICATARADMRLVADEARDLPLATVGRTGSGLGNLAARVEAAGGRLAVGRDEGEFSLVAEIPLPARA
jgi:signal transduction histidine kinase